MNVEQRGIESKEKIMAKFQLISCSQRKSIAFECLLKEPSHQELQSFPAHIIFPNSFHTQKKIAPTF